MDKKIILFGAGKRGLRALEKYGANKIAFFCDNSINLQGEYISGKKVISFEELCKCHQDYKVVVTVFKDKYLKEIVKQLIKNEIDYTIYSDECVFEGDIKSIFSYIYKNELWGKGTWYSGEGSHDNSIIQPYISLLVSLIKNNGIKYICDVGCGDFNIMSQVLEKVEDDFALYQGLDVVDELVERNIELYGSDKIKFYCVNAADESVSLPDGDLCIVRQVLQHLDNKSIGVILSKLSKYKYILITEHIYDGDDAIYNSNQSIGGGIRLNHLSGVYLDKPPYNIPMVHLLKCPQYGGVIRTSLIINNK